MGLYGLIGKPLTHSFSAEYFSRKFKSQGINSEYRNFSLDHISFFPELIRSENLQGLNVTVPYKQEVLPYLHELDEVAERVGAVNTIKIIGEAGGDRLKGFNTDVPGFRGSLERGLDERHKEALVLGTGGAAAAVKEVLRQLDIPFREVSRSAGQGKLTYAELTPGLVREHRLIVNTSPVGMYPGIDKAPEIPYEGIGPDHFCFDLIYNPELTLFLEKAEAGGARIMNGYHMLELQAEASWEIWNDPDK